MKYFSNVGESTADIVEWGFLSIDVENIHFISGRREYMKQAFKVKSRAANKQIDNLLIILNGKWESWKIKSILNLKIRGAIDRTNQDFLQNFKKAKDKLMDVENKTRAVYDSLQELKFDHQEAIEYYFPSM